MKYNIKVKTKHIKNIVVAFILLFLVKCFFNPLITEKRTVLQHENNNDILVDFAEMDSFLEVWSQYCQKGYHKIMGDSISFYNKKLEEIVPQNIQIWLNRRDWDVERFYYVEQRIRTALKEAILHNHYEYNKNMLSAGGVNVNRSNLQKIVNEQDRREKIQESSKEEIDMIKENISAINNVLNCKMVYKP